MNGFSLNHLSYIEFENFCFDLLHSIGFVNLDWRKGTGLNSSPSDKGRDIQGEIIKKEIDGKEFIETWFFECKHYKKGVPASELNNAITWANAERPDVLLIIVSNFLSNNAKEYINSYIKENKPSFKIKYWERPDLEKLTINNNSILRKYKIITPLKQPNDISKIHLLYISNLNLNSLDFLFSLLDKMDKKIREKVLGHTFFTIINPRFRKPITMDEKIRDLLIDTISYESFKDKCKEIAKTVSESFLVNSIIVYTLQYLFMLGDKSRIEETVDNHKFLIRRLKEEISTKKTEKEKKQIRIMIIDSKKMIKEMPERFEKAYENYIYFCKNVVLELFKEELIFKGIKKFEKLFEPMK